MGYIFRPPFMSRLRPARPPHTIPRMKAHTAAFVVALACLGLIDTQAFTGPAITASCSRTSSRSSSNTRVGSTAAADSTAVGER